MNCQKVQSLCETFLDGELDQDQTLDIEAHLDACVRCAEYCHLCLAIRSSTRRVVMADAQVRDGFLTQLDQALTAERNRQGRSEAVVSLAAAGGSIVALEAPKKSHWPQVGSLLAAAAVLLMWYQKHELVERHQPSQQPRIATASTNAGGGVEQALDRLIDYHSSPPQPVVFEEDLVRTFESDVGVRVHAPSLRRFGALWEGASIVAVTDQDQPAAYLRYRMPAQHVTVYVYDPRKVALKSSLAQRVINDHPVYVGHWRGYSVAAKENQGIGYALAAALDDESMAELITEIH